ncbi:hypothetical protein QBA57_00005 [Streptomyces scabiei]|uniref:hypothetical protein n=1 Tax=Streptomyces scabiei TaxID=1930 RepID=UPI002FEFFFD7
MRHEQHGVTPTALKALGAFAGPQAGARDVIRSLTTATDALVLPAAVTAPVGRRRWT